MDSEANPRNDRLPFHQCLETDQTGLVSAFAVVMAATSVPGPVAVAGNHVAVIDAAESADGMSVSMPTSLRHDARRSSIKAPLAHEGPSVDKPKAPRLPCAARSTSPVLAVAIQRNARGFGVSQM